MPIYPSYCTIHEVLIQRHYILCVPFVFRKKKDGVSPKVLFWEPSACRVHYHYTYLRRSRRHWLYYRGANLKNLGTFSRRERTYQRMNYYPVHSYITVVHRYIATDTSLFFAKDGSWSFNFVVSSLWPELPFVRSASSLGVLLLPFFPNLLARIVFTRAAVFRILTCFMTSFQGAFFFQSGIFVALCLSFPSRVTLEL